MIFIATFFVLRNKIKNDIKNIALLRALGFNSRYIRLVLGIELLLILMLSIFLAYGLIYGCHFSYLIVRESNISIFLKDLCISKYLKESIIVLLSLIINISLLRIKNLNVINILNEE